MKEHNEIDWNGKLEAWRDGEEPVEARVVKEDGGHMPYHVEIVGKNTLWFTEDGNSMVGWRIRNAPQAPQEAAGAICGVGADSEPHKPSETLWGAPIEANGVRPGWLGDGERVKWRKAGELDFKGPCDAGDHRWEGAPRYPSVTEDIRLPADHPYYLATSKGFTYWPGGDEAPGDWCPVKGGVLLRNGMQSVHPSRWNHSPEGEFPCQYDIIGYRPRQTPAFDPAPHLATYDPAREVVVKRMTTADVEKFGYPSERAAYMRFARDHGILVEGPADTLVATYGIPRETAEAMVEAGWRK